MGAADHLDSYLAQLDPAARRLARGEWGLDLEAGGWPLHVGIALRGGLLRAQAQVLPPGGPPAEHLLHLNRRLALVRVAATRAGELWLIGDLPLAAATPEALDAVLAALVDAAETLRAAASA